MRKGAALTGNSGACVGIVVEVVSEGRDVVVVVVVVVVEVISEGIVVVVVVDVVVIEDVVVVVLEDVVDDVVVVDVVVELVEDVVVDVVEVVVEDVEVVVVVEEVVDVVLEDVVDVVVDVVVELVEDVVVDVVDEDVVVVVVVVVVMPPHIVVILLESSVTAVCANALPHNVAPVCSAIFVLSRIFPLKTDVVPSVVAPATCQKMLFAWQPPLRVTIAPLPTVRVSAIWKMKTALVLPSQLRVTPLASGLKPDSILSPLLHL
jgi:hypothetical protein